MRKVKAFVFLTVVLGILAAALLYRVAPGVEDASIATLTTLAFLALTAELLAVVLPRGVRGSMAFIPYMATVLLVPTFSALITIVSVRSLAELVGKKERLRQVFNIGQFCLTFGITILLYRALHGVSFFELHGASFQSATRQLGAASLISFLCSYTINTVWVSCVLALSTNGRPLQIWREVHLSTIGLDILASPLIFVFAWIYTEWGPILAAAFWMPILGLRQLHTTNLELEQTNRELLELMIKSIEARDPYTSGHSRRVSGYAVQIARLMGVGPSEVEKIGTAALLHDVGKIFDKYAPILAKDERLTANEWAIIKEHPRDGAELISTMTKLRELVPAVRHHHENWDGTGYPSGLKGEAIPLASRIIMFADTIDAMTTQRPYRGPLDEGIVRSEILRCRGRQFDPNIADRLLANDFWKTLFPPRPLAPSRKNSLQIVAGGLRG